MNLNLSSLNNKIIKCRACPRLIKFRNKIVKNKRKQFKDEVYWGKPITGFGDPKGKILFVGLAPAAHGGTRTGRVFTGDKSSDFLYKCLFNAKISNQSTSDHINDGLKLKNAFITPALKCVPPEDKPLSNEILNCSKFFYQEIFALKRLRVIVPLGKTAFDNCIKLYKQRFNIKKKFIFKHGKIQSLPNGLIILSSYHPSPRNVNTKLISNKMMVNLFKKARELARF